MLLLEMVSVMMKQTMSLAITMGETVVEMLKQITALNVSAIYRCLVLLDILLLQLEMEFVTMSPILKIVCLMD